MLSLFYDVFLPSMYWTETNRVSYLMSWNTINSVHKLTIDKYLFIVNNKWTLSRVTLLPKVSLSLSLTESESLNLHFNIHRYVKYGDGLLMLLKITLKDSFRTETRGLYLRNMLTVCPSRGNSFVCRGHPGLSTPSLEGRHYKCLEVKSITVTISTTFQSR